MRWLVVVILVTVLALALAIIPGLLDSGDPATVLELAELLRAEGVDFDTTEILADNLWDSAVVEEGLMLRGEGLYLDILRIEDRETFHAAEQAWHRMTTFGGGLLFEAQAITEVYARRPYVVVIRQEPTQGQVAKILRTILPPDLT